MISKTKKNKKAGKKALAWIGASIMVAGLMVPGCNDRASINKTTAKVAVHLCENEKSKCTKLSPESSIALVYHCKNSTSSCTLIGEKRINTKLSTMGARIELTKDLDKFIREACKKRTNRTQVIRKEISTLEIINPVSEVRSDQSVWYEKAKEVCDRIK